MNPHRFCAAEHLADVVPVFLYRQPRAVVPWRATVVLEETLDTGYTRVTAGGFTRAHAERRARRELLRYVLAGWWT